MLESGRVTRLARREDEAQRPTTPIRRQVNLGGQPTAGAPDGMVGGLAGRPTTLSRASSRHKEVSWTAQSHLLGAPEAACRSEQKNLTGNLVEALARTGRVGIARFAVHTR